MVCEGRFTISFRSISSIPLIYIMFLLFSDVFRDCILWPRKNSKIWILTWTMKGIRNRLKTWKNTVMVDLSTLLSSKKLLRIFIKIAFCDQKSCFYDQKYAFFKQTKWFWSNKFSARSSLGPRKVLHHKLDIISFQSHFQWAKNMHYSCDNPAFCVSRQRIEVRFT